MAETETYVLFAGPHDGLERQVPRGPDGDMPVIELGLPASGEATAAGQPVLLDFSRYEFDETSGRYLYVGTTREAAG
jgi:hypothetical protein